jgi:nitroreductase
MELMESIRQRRSIRQFQEKDIPDKDLKTILEAVQWAPSWANTQCWEIVVVKDVDIKLKLQETLPSSNPAFKGMMQAPVVLAVCGKKEKAGFYHGKATTRFGDWMMFDLGLATQNICLTAHALGLGTVVVGLLDHPKADRILKLPDGYETVALLPLGVPLKPAKAPPRREIDDFMHDNIF